MFWCAEKTATDSSLWETSGASEIDNQVLWNDVLPQLDLPYAIMNL